MSPLGGGGGRAHGYQDSPQASVISRCPHVLSLSLQGGCQGLLAKKTFQKLFFFFCEIQQIYGKVKKT